MMNESAGNLQRYAMLLGTYLGVFWILKFVLLPLGVERPFLLLLFVGLTLCVPFMSYRYTRMYRDRVCGGSIGFGHAWLFHVLMYLFAAMLTAVGHYVYFRYLDGGYICNAVERNMEEAARLYPLPEMEAYVELVKTSVQELRATPPIRQAMQMLSQNVFYGILIGIPVALIVMRKPKEGQA